MFCLAVSTNAMVWITTAPIATTVHKIYDVDEFWVEACALVYMLFYLPVVFPSNFILDEYGLKVGVTIGVVLTAAGGLLRIGGYSEIWYILAGNSVAALGQPFLLSAPAKLAAYWFRAEKVMEN